MQKLTIDIDKYLDEQKNIVNESLDKYMYSADEYPNILHESMRYSVFSPGKRFRPILAIASCSAVCGNFDNVISSACALEMIHAYSLIHDDLPAMDNDDYRRGKLSNHKKFGEDIAILAGDALLTLAFEIMDETAVKDIAKAIGSLGVVGGQIVDMQLARGELELNLPLIEYIHTKKTGALIAVACRIGAKLAGGSPEVISALESYGRAIGFAFQIVDDIFDNENYAVLIGENQSKKSALEFVDIAKKHLDCLPEQNREILYALADFVVSRKS